MTIALSNIADVLFKIDVNVSMFGVSELNYVVEAFKRLNPRSSAGQAV